jgi:hypothetical protein
MTFDKIKLKLKLDIKIKTILTAISSLILTTYFLNRLGTPRAIKLTTTGLVERLLDHILSTAYRSGHHTIGRTYTYLKKCSKEQQSLLNASDVELYGKIEISWIVFVRKTKRKRRSNRDVQDID